MRFPIDFNEGDGPTPKRFLVFGHSGNACICAKTTSKTERLKSDGKLLAGVVMFKPKEIECFELETAIDPANVFAISQ